jgi:hypothetical protein
MDNARGIRIEKRLALGVVTQRVVLQRSKK